MRSRNRSGGFTILEILIAIVILVIGISGIIALFPTAIESGNQTVQDSYAAAITQSVIDAVSVGLRESRYRMQDNAGRTWVYFIFDHDGVWDVMQPSPQNYTDQVADSDWCILLPQGANSNNDARNEPMFNYPGVRSQDGLGGGPGYVDVRHLTQLTGYPTSVGQAPLQGCDDWAYPEYWRPNPRGGAGVNSELIPYVRRVYYLGRYRKGQELPQFPSPAQAPGTVRDEFLGELMGPAVTGDLSANRPVVDPYPQYSFCLSMRRAKIDNMTAAGPGQAAAPIPDGQITKEDMFSSSLYEVRVMVFRNFDGSVAIHNQLATQKTQPVPRTNVPLREFVTLMSL